MCVCPPPAPCDWVDFGGHVRTYFEGGELRKCFGKHLDGYGLVLSACLRLGRKCHRHGLCVGRGKEGAAHCRCLRPFSEIRRIPSTRDCAQQRHCIDKTAVERRGFAGHFNATCCCLRVRESAIAIQISGHWALGTRPGALEQQVEGGASFVPFPYSHCSACFEVSAMCAVQHL